MSRDQAGLIAAEGTCLIEGWTSDGDQVGAQVRPHRQPLAVGSHWEDEPGRGGGGAGGLGTPAPTAPPGFGSWIWNIHKFILSLLEVCVCRPPRGCCLEGDDAARAGAVRAAIKHCALTFVGLPPI